MKRRLILTENSLKKMIKESVKNVVCEFIQQKNILFESYSQGTKSFDDFLSEYDEWSVFSMFQSNEKPFTNLINPTMYQKALSEFVKFGKFINFPTKYIYQWMGIIMTNTSIIASITNIAGHSYYSPIDSFIDFYFNDDADEWQEYKNQIEVDGDYEAMCTFLDEKGFWNWAVLPDGSDAYSDYGLEPLYEICQEYDENKSPEEIIVLVNKALDITHCRGDLASAFIIGGAKTLSQISEV